MILSYLNLASQLTRIKKRKLSKRKRKITKNQPIQGFKNIPKFSAPVSQYSKMYTTKPVVTSSYLTSNVKHRECVATVFGSTVFAVGTWVVNPGNYTTFPWLAGIANLWEEYRFNKLQFEYVCRCATTKPGSVAMAPDYDVNDPAPDGMEHMLSYQNAVETVAYDNCICILDFESMKGFGGKHFVCNAKPLNTDPKTYDVARFYIATEGQDGTTMIGRLYVDYDIDLYVPQVTSAPVSLGVQLNKDGDGVTITKLLGNVTDNLIQQNIQLDVLDNSIRIGGAVIGDEYLLDYTIGGATLTTAPTITPISGAVLKSNWYNYTTGTIAQAKTSFTCVDGVMSFSLGGLTVVTTPNHAMFEIFGVPPLAL